MITYAGVGLPLCPPDVAAWCRENIDPRTLCPFDPRWNPADLRRLNLPPAPEPPPVEVGVLRWPQSASRWATFFAVVDGATLAAIKAVVDAASSPAGTAGGHRPADLVIADGSGGTVTAAVTMTEPRPLSGVADQLFLLPLVDDRWFWWAKPWVRPGVMANADGSTRTTWAELFATFQNSLAHDPTAALRTIAVDAVPAAYRFPNPDNWWGPENAGASPGALAPLRLESGWLPVPPALDAAAAAVGMRFVRTLAGVNKVQSAANARAAHEAEFAAAGRVVLAGGRVPAADLRRAAPAAVRVYFDRDGPSLDGGTPTTAVTLLGSTFVTEDVKLYDLQLPEYAGHRGRQFAASNYDIAVVWADYVATFRGRGTTAPTNRAAMGELAVQAATDYYRWRLADADVVWAGAVGSTPNGFADAIEWRAAAGPDGEPAVATRYRSPAPATRSTRAAHAHDDPPDCYAVMLPTTHTVTVGIGDPGEKSVLHKGGYSTGYWVEVPSGAWLVTATGPVGTDVSGTGQGTGEKYYVHGSLSLVQITGTGAADWAGFGGTTGTTAGSDSVWYDEPASPPTSPPSAAGPYEHVAGGHSGGVHQTALVMTQGMKIGVVGTVGDGGILSDLPLTGTTITATVGPVLITATAVKTKPNDAGGYYLVNPAGPFPALGPSVSPAAWSETRTAFGTFSKTFTASGGVASPPPTWVSVSSNRAVVAVSANGDTATPTLNALSNGTATITTTLTDASGQPAVATGTVTVTETPPGPDELRVYGVASDLGGPLAGVLVRLTDATLTSVGSDTTGADGVYDITVPASAQLYTWIPTLAGYAATPTQATHTYAGPGLEAAIQDFSFAPVSPPPPPPP